jgi:hypothetical protein
MANDENFFGVDRQEHLTIEEVLGRRVRDPVANPDVTLDEGHVLSMVDEEGYQRRTRPLTLDEMKAARAALDQAIALETMRTEGS